MALLDIGVGNLINRLGKCGLLVSQADSYLSAQRTNLINTISGINAQFTDEPDIRSIIDSSYVGVLGGVGNVGSLAASIASEALNRAVYRDRMNFAVTRALADDNGNTLDSLSEMLRQMKGGNKTFRPQTVTATVVNSVFTNALFPGIGFSPGNGIIVTSIRRPSDGYALQNTLAEDLEVLCTADSFTDGATAGNESFSIIGTNVQADPFSFDWPLGSGANIALSAIDGSKDNASGNKLTNSGFDRFTNNIPDKWERITGVAGTHILRETSLVYDSGSALRFSGDGSNLTTIRQKFNDSSLGTAGKLEPLTQYSHNLFIRRDGGANIGAGVLRVRLVDGNGTTINDAFTTPNANSTTIDLTTINDVYTAYNISFRTPLILPPVFYLEYSLTTAITNGRNIYIDKASLGLMSQTATHGIFAAIHAGSVPFKRGDRNIIRTTNGRGAAGTLNTFATLIFRLYPECRDNEFIFPYAGVAGQETFVDSVLIA